MPNTVISGKHCRIHFRVQCEASLGQDIGVSGNISILGNFEKSKYYRLYTTPESYPVWTSVDPILVPIGHVLSYKYCLVECGEFKTYEKCENRIFIPEKTDNFVEDHFIIEEIEASPDSELELFQEMKVLTATPTEESKVDLSEISSGSRLIIVCYHLPVLVKRNVGNSAEPFIVTWAESLIAKSSNNSVSNSFDTHWMGTMSVPGDVPNDQEMEFLLKTLHDMNCHPIFLDTELANKAYHGFCKLIMWPIFHNVDQMDQIHAAWKLFPPDGRTNTESPQNDQIVLDWNSDINQLEDAYFELNRIFAKHLGDWLHVGDTVWVHDYHLMHLPQLIRNLGRNIKVVFFLHIPFPTSQIFRSLPTATPLLQSMAAADVVGFHTFDHARHFLTAMKRILGIRCHTKQGGILVLDVQDREVIVTVSHVSVEVHDIDRVLENPDTWSNANDIKKMCHNRKIIVGLDVGQRLSGGALKLAAYEKFLSDNPKEVNKTVMFQKVVRSSSRQGDEMTTSIDMKEMVERINGKFSIVREDGTILPAIIYEEIPLRSATLADRITLWLASDVFLLTPIKEGLNLYPLEFIYAHEARGRREGQGSGASPSNGVVIASEFSTCSSLLNGALKINPYFTLTVADTIHKALYMPVTEAHQRRQRDLNFISSHPSSLWTKEILSDLRHVENRQSRNLTKTNHLICYPDPLPVDEILKSFHEACHSSQYGISDHSSRVFIFDYGGTLLHKERSDIYIKQSLSAISGRSPSETTLASIRSLASDPRNCILIVTGLTKLKLGDLFSDMANVTIGTSNGLVHSWGANLLTYDEMDKIASSAKLHDPTSPVTSNPNSNSNNSLLKLTMKDINEVSSRWWDSLHFDVDWEAVRDIAVPIITKFTFRTNGTCQTPRIPGIGWSYFGADPEWGERQAGQCRLELEAALAKHDVKVVSQIQGSIEVVPKDLNKGVIVSKFLNRVMKKRSGLLPAFAVVIGDDESDDFMYRSLYHHLVHSCPNADLARSRSFTVVVGRRQCPAQYYVNEVSDIETLLSSFAQSTLSPSISSPLSPNKKIIVNATSKITG